MKTFLILIAIFQYSLVFSQELTCSFKGTRIQYINGVGNSEKDALASKKKLAEAFQLDSKSLDKLEVVEFKYTYNHTFGSIEDFLESGAQTIHSQAASIGLDISVRSAYVLLFRTIYSISAEISPFLTPFVISWLGDVQARANTEQIDVNKIKSDVIDVLKQDKKLILVSHSQGNLFVNRALEELQGDTTFNYQYYEKVISNVRFATPESRALAYHNSYVNNSEDFINPFSDASPNYALVTPDETADLRPYSDTFLNHGFIETYLFNMADPFIDQDPFVYEENLSLTFLRKFSIDAIKKSALSLNEHPKCPKAVFKYTENTLDYTVSFDSTDPDDSTRQDLTYIWNFGDGKSETTTSKTITHIYELPGDYVVSLRVTDSRNIDFGEDAYTQKNLAIGGIIGCGSERGKYHFNPDGTIGGFVANTASVSSTSYISSQTSICGNTQILGVSSIDIEFSPRSKITNSTIIDSNIAVKGDLIIESSTISNMTVNEVTTFQIYGSNITGLSISLKARGGFQIRSSDVTSTVITASGHIHDSISWVDISASQVVSMNFLNLSGSFILENNNILYSIGHIPVYEGPISGWPF